MNFSKDLVLKSDGRNGVFSNRKFLFKNCCRHLPYSSFQDLLAVLLGSTYVDACSDLGHSSESLRWATLHGIRRGFFFKKNDLAHEILILASLCISCVRGTAEKSAFHATLSHKVKFSKDIVIKSEGIISHKYFLMLFLQQHFSF